MADAMVDDAEAALTSAFADAQRATAAVREEAKQVREMKAEVERQAEETRAEAERQRNELQAERDALANARVLPLNCHLTSSRLPLPTTRILALGPPLTHIFARVSALLGDRPRTALIR